MTTKRIGAREANQQFSALLKEIEDSGDVVIITRRGRPIAELRAAAPAPARDRAAVARRMQELFEKYSRPMGFTGIDRESIYTRGFLDPKRPLE
ncbi:MAG: type II toxin-antitoxin system Phd/YefM family antitoxin [Vulcanimicrobiaceae bacterium]